MHCQEFDIMVYWGYIQFLFVGLYENAYSKSPPS